MTDRVKQIASHLNYPKGLLNGEVAIITGRGRQAWKPKLQRLKLARL